MEPYTLKWNLQNDKYILYPGTLLRPRIRLKDILLSQDKILINAARATGNPWRLYAAIDRIGVIPGPGFYCVHRKKKEAPEPELIAAVINSPIASAFIDSYARKRWIVSTKIEDIPIPFFNARQKQEIIEIVRAIEKTKSANAFEGGLDNHLVNGEPVLQNKAGRRNGFATHLGIKSLRRLIEHLDQMIYGAYGLTDNEVQRIKHLFRRFPRPGAEWRDLNYEQDRVKLEPIEKVWKVTGRIAEINPKDNTISLWLWGYNEMGHIVEIQIPETLPGWALDNAVSFEATIPYEQKDEEDIAKLDFIEFRPLRNAYLSDEQIQKIMRR